MLVENCLRRERCVYASRRRPPPEQWKRPPVRLAPFLRARRITRYAEEKAETIRESAVLEGRPLTVSSCGILSTKCSYPGDSAGGQRTLRGVATVVGGSLAITSAPFHPCVRSGNESTRHSLLYPIGRSRDALPGRPPIPACLPPLATPPPPRQDGGLTNKNSSAK